MQRTFISRSCLNGSRSSRCTSDLTPLTTTRSVGNFGNKHKKKTRTDAKSQSDPRSRERRLKQAGEEALAAKYERNAYNKAYRERRSEQRETAQDWVEDRRTYEVASVYRRAMQQPAKDAMKAMKEDWALGPLAPKRDFGENADKLGTVDMGLHTLHNLTTTQIEDVKARMGDNVFKPQDRVVVLTGRDRGKIGTILSVDEEKMSAQIEGINNIAVHVPEYMAQHDQDNRSFRVMRKDVRLDELKLVVGIRDPTTQVLKDVVLDRMDLKKVLVPDYGKIAEIKPNQEITLHDVVAKKMQEAKEGTTHSSEAIAEHELNSVPERQAAVELIREERVKGKVYELEDYRWKTIRSIPGTETEIMDSSDKDDHAYDAEAGMHDTWADKVDEPTFTPDIIESPMSEKIFSEISLTGRKEVTRYGESLEAKIKEGAEAKMRKQMELEDRVRTPLQELKVALKKEQRKERGKRMAVSGLGYAPAQKKEREMVVVKDEDGRVDWQAYKERSKAMKTKEMKTKETKPVTDIMVQIGRAMALNWAKNPQAVTGARKQKLARVLELEMQSSDAARPEARV